MIRAAVLIGVADTGGYPHLEAVGKGLDEVQAWIVSQGDFGDRVAVISDHTGTPVTVTQIKDAVRGFVETGTVEQLLIYYAGHGMNVGYQEFWLLSDAPDDPNAAVNLGGTMALARHCGIPHVVFISDACRSAAGSITAHAISGSLIFPNRGPRRGAGAVDVFYAAAVGDPALEVRPAAAAAGEYHAIYTTSLMNGLNGKDASIIEPSPQTGKGVIRPWPLQRYLPRAVTEQLTQAGLSLTESQVPDAVISSPPETWLATASAPRATRSGLGFARRKPTQETLSTLSERAVTQAIGGQAVDTGAIAGTRVPGSQDLIRHIDASTAEPPVEFTTHCGFVVKGMHATHGWSRLATTALVGAGTQVEVTLPDRAPAANILLEFANGTGALLPAIPQFVGTLTFDGDRLMAVSYEPAGGTPLRQEFEPDLPALGALRRTIATVARLGTFRLNSDSADKLISAMRQFKAVDPSLAVYAAHALADLGRPGDVADMDKYVAEHLHLHLFDVALLMRTPDTDAPMLDAIYPAVPLLTQGWPLLEAYDVVLAEPLAQARRHLTNSLWTLFTPNGVAVLKEAITSGVI